MAGKEKPKAKKAGKNDYKMPEKFPKGEVLVDRTKTQWVLGSSIGVGGFGEIYSGAKAEAPSKFSFAVKIEPLENGPLFCERNVYLNIGKKEDIDQFTSSKKLKHLGIPLFHGFGSHLFKKTDYRFIVIQKLGKDVWTYFKANKSIPYATCLKICIQILHVYEYMHSKGYVHCDVKGANLLLGEDAGGQNHVFVVDFGLACKYSTTYTPNPKKAHNGTIEYTSRDAHLGVMTRRGDLEILAYNLIHWTSSTLPWEGQSNPVTVQSMKNEMMDNPEKLLKACYTKEPPKAAIKEFLKEVGKLSPLDEPPYQRFIDILMKDLKSLKSDVNKLDFKAETKVKPVKSPVKRASPRKKAAAATVTSEESEENSIEEGVAKKAPVSRKRTLNRAFSETDLNKKKVSKPETPRRKTAKTKAANGVVKRSWRDCPTIVNGAKLNNED